MKKGLFLIALLILPTANAIEGLQLTAYLDDIIYIGQTYTKLFKIKNLDHIAGKKDCINLTLGYNISNITSTAKIICLNAWKTANTGEFTPVKTGNYTLCGWIINSTVNDTNKEDDYDCKNIIVLKNQIIEEEKPMQTQEPESEPQQDSEIEILDVDEEAKFGETIDVKLRIYRGNTRKYAVRIKVKDATGTAKLHIREKFKNFTFTIPLQIKPNCNKKLQEGAYKLKVEGLDASDSKKIKISGFKRGICNKCVKCKCPQNLSCEQESQQSEEGIKTKQFIECAAKKMPVTVYKSSDQKAKELIPKFLITITTAFAIILIWRR